MSTLRLAPTKNQQQEVTTQQQPAQQNQQGPGQQPVVQSSQQGPTQMDSSPAFKTPGRFMGQPLGATSPRLMHNPLFVHSFKGSPGPRFAPRDPRGRMQPPQRGPQMFPYPPPPPHPQQQQQQQTAATSGGPPAGANPGVGLAGDSAGASTSQAAGGGTGGGGGGRSSWAQVVGTAATLQSPRPAQGAGNQ